MTADCFLPHYPRTMNVATIKVGRRGQIKHILPSKQSSLNQKTNFRTMIMPFCFLFRFLPFFSKKIWVPQFPEVPWSVHPKFSNTLTRLKNLFFKSVAFSFTDIKTVFMSAASNWKTLQLHNSPSSKKRKMRVFQTFSRSVGCLRIK